MGDFFSLYDTIIDNIDPGTTVERTVAGERWSGAVSGGTLGMAMAMDCDSRPPMFPTGLAGMDVKEIAPAIKSWNLREASLALSAVNLRLNSAERMEALGCGEPFKNYCTDGLDVRGKTVAAIGHLHLTEEIHREAKQVYILEREPQSGDYPDSACDLILPQCDIVIITGATIINKTLPHLLSLCKNAYTILIGPSVPMCPALLEHGIDRLSGLAVTDPAAMERKIAAGERGSPYGFGQSWLIKK